MNCNRNPLAHRLSTTPRSAAYGFSLIEFMIAMTIGLVIIAAAAQIYLSSSATYRIDEGLQRVQEDARFAMDFLAKDVRMAGYLGCNSSLTPNNKVKNPDESTYFYAGGMKGYTYSCTGTCTGQVSNWTPPLPAGFFVDWEVRTGSDVIVIYRISEIGTTLDGNLPPSNANIQIVNTGVIAGQIADDDILILSDCEKADIFRVNNISNPNANPLTITHSASVNNPPPQLSKAYGPDARLSKMIARAYYVGTNPTTNEPGLYYKELGNGGTLVPGQELVGGVEAMRFLYGLDKSGSGIAEQYVVANDVANWLMVKSVRLGFVVRTPESVDSELDTRTYNVLDNTASALDDFDPVDDRRRRRVFNSTIQVRNH